jgi:hypothetical protein
VIIIALFTGIVVLYHDRDDPCGLFGEVYDDSEPAVWLDVLAVEALPIGNRVQSAMVRSRDRPHDHIEVIEQPGTPTSQMQARAHVEDDLPPVGVGCVGMLVGHGSEPYARVGTIGWFRYRALGTLPPSTQLL